MCTVWICNQYQNKRFVVIDVDECLEENKCDKRTEKCENSEGSYECSCKSGYKRQDGKCIKAKGNKNAKRNKQIKDKKYSADDQDPLAKFLKENSTLSEVHLKIGTFLYACFFACLYYLFRREQWIGICIFVALFIVCIVLLNRSYPPVDTFNVK